MIYRFLLRPRSCPPSPSPVRLMSAEHGVTAFSKNQPKERQLRPVLVTVRIAGPAKEQPYSNLPTRIFIGLIGRQAPHIRAAALEPALRALVLPQGIGQVWMAGEALVV